MRRALAALLAALFCVSNAYAGEIGPRRALLSGNKIKPVFQTNLTAVSALPSQITFSRASNATLFDSTGKLTYAPNNQILQSQTFANSSWLKTAVGTGSVAPTVTDNFAVAPDGTTTASRVQFTAGASGGGSRLFQGGISGLFNLGSIYLKTNDGTTKTLFLTTGAGAQTITVTSAWQRFNQVPGTGTNFQFGTNTGGYNGTTTDLTADILAWGTQFEAVTYQTTPSTYNPTTSSAYFGPRFDYDPSTLAAKGLLSEEQRQNVLLQSNNLANASWLTFTTGSSTISRTAASGTSPDGTNNATLVTINRSVTTLGAGDALIYQPVTTTAQKYQGSVWVMANSGADVGKVISTSQYDATNVVNGSNVTLTASWQRVSLLTTNALTAASCQPLRIGYDSAVTNSQTGSISFLVYGGQGEPGATFPTSYIPTTTASVTRSADIAQLTGTALAALQGSAASVFGEYSDVASVGSTLIGLGPVNLGKFLQIGENKVSWFNLQSSTASGFVANVANRTAASWTTAGVGSIVLNGSTVQAFSGSDYTGAATVANLGSRSDSTQFMNGHLAKLAIYNTRLPDSKLRPLSVVGAPF